MNEKVNIRQLKTGVPGLDNLLGGGIPEFSFNLIAGAPGSGKTTLAHQIMFSLASPDNRALFFTTSGEPAIKMLRYQQQFPFFDLEKVRESIHFINLSVELMEESFNSVLKRIEKEVKNYSPGLIFVDSFRSVIDSDNENISHTSSLQQFVQKLGIQMSSWQATTFLIGEYVGTRI
ncbi:KaiC/GvpD/RAD55 family RecA-like ATPase [Undibacterium sp. GrIS 1.2]|uniref:RAD55 family ATPase n=1 Tax=Undibacterium sp. GrIS 1.2 TaxID=3143933 RepID=UPI003396F9A5